MSQSKRHHYIPQFLIKNFADADGLIYVYNKIDRRILRNKQSPKQIFFELGRNTVDFSGTPLDNLEQLYSALDSKLAIDITGVLRNIGDNKSITPEEVASIIILASMLKWRTPTSDAKFNILKEDTTQEDLGIKLTIKDESMKVDAVAISLIEQSDIFKESKRVMLPFLPLIEGEKLLHIHNHSFINTNERFPSLIGDCPLIEKPNSDIRSIENFIFPLSANDTFIYNSGPNRGIISPLFYLQRDMAILHLSEKYVGCKNRDHLEKIIKMYDQACIDNQDTFIAKFVFEHIV